MRAFTDILVMPTQGLLNGIADPRERLRRGIVRGGPVWPFFHLQVRARHCRGLLPVPRDRRPRAAPGPVETAGDGVWCGPASPHFGHMIADFAMRIAESAHRWPDLPLVFSVRPEAEAEPAAFFWQILAQLGAARERVVLIRRPTRFRRLFVAPQAERLHGRGPSPAHLDLMDRVSAAHGPVDRDIAHLFVSRSRFPDARLMGESYLDAALERAGATVIHPETLTVAEQVRFYRRARTIVFSEGSAIHGLQLLGRVDADVVVLVRRPGERIARTLLAPRVASLRYWEVTTGLIHGTNARGRPQLDRALSRFDEADLLARFAGLGLDLAAHWDRAAYRACRDADLVGWVAYMKFQNLHPSAAATIQACLTAQGLALRVEDVPPLGHAG